MANKKFGKSSGTSEGHKGLINITVETDKLVNLGTDVFDIGAVLDNDNTNLVKQYPVAGTIYKKNSGTMTLPSTTTDILTDIIAVRLLPTLCGRQGQRRVQLAFKDQFVKVVGDAYYSSNVTEADLIKLFMYNESLGALLMKIGAALKLHTVYSKVNAPVCEAILTAMGFSTRIITTERQQWIDAYNRLAKLLNEKFYLASNEAIKQYYYLLNHVFLDGNSQKAQPIVFNTVFYTDINNVDGTLKPDTIYWAGDHTGFISNPVISLSSVLGTIGDAETFSNSAWYSQVAPLLMHLYGDDKNTLFKFDLYAEERLSFTFNYDVVNALRNSKIAQGLIDPNADIVSTATIWEDSNGYICQGGTNLSGTRGLMINYIIGGQASSDESYLKRLDGHYCSLDQWPASSSDKLLSQLFYFIEGDVVEGGAAVAGAENWNYIDWCSHILIVYMEHVKFNNDAFSFTTEPVYDYVFASSGLPASVSYRSGKFTTVSGVYEHLMKTSCDNVSKNIFVMDAGGGSPAVTSISRIIPWLHDKDDVMFITDDTLRNLYLQYSYDSMVFPVPSFRTRK